MVISPDEGGMGRAIYIANVLGSGYGYVLQDAETTPELLTDEIRSLLTNSWVPA